MYLLSPLASIPYRCFLQRKHDKERFVTKIGAWLIYVNVDLKWSSIQNCSLGCFQITSHTFLTYLSIFVMVILLTKWLRYHGNNANTTGSLSNRQGQQRLKCSIFVDFWRLQNRGHTHPTQNAWFTIWYLSYIALPNEPISCTRVRHCLRLCVYVHSVNSSVCHKEQEQHKIVIKTNVICIILKPFNSLKLTLPCPHITHKQHSPPWINFENLFLREWCSITHILC